MARRGFRDLTEASPSSRWLRRVMFVVLAVWLPSAAFSGFRAIVQIFDLEVRTSTATLVPGTVIEADVVTSGRAHADVVLELRHGSTTDTLASVFVAGNRDGALDPRPRRASLRVVLTKDRLALVRPGPATVRAIATGRSQWLRLPPPTVIEIAATIAP